MVGHIDIGHIDKTGLWVTYRDVGEMCVQSMGEMRKDFCPNLFQPFFSIGFEILLFGTCVVLSVSKYSYYAKYVTR